MTKELEALEKAKMDMDYHRKYECHYYYPKEEREEYFSIIETALKALDIIKENLNIDEILLAVKGVCKASDYDLLKEVLL